MKHILQFCILFIFIFYYNFNGYSQVMTTEAGNGLTSFSGDGSLATSAQVSGPQAFAYDTAGNLFIVDGGNNRIRKISTTGIITTIAGNGIAADAGDGGLATAASLNLTAAVVSTGWGFLYTHCGVAFDKKNNLYISENSGNRIRKINTSGIITTFAGNGTPGSIGDGGLATAAELFTPSGITFDTLGNLFIADCYNNKIRKIDTFGIISTIVGTSTGGFNADGCAPTVTELNSPTDVAIDLSGNIYIADCANQRIRKVNTALNIVQTIAGNMGGWGFTGDGGIDTNAKLTNPTGVRVDALGNIYIADNSNNRIRIINTSNIITTIAGNGTGSYIGDGMLATASEINQPEFVNVDATGNIIIADYGNNRIRKINASGIISTIVSTGYISFGGDGGPSTNAELNNPSAVVYNHTNDYFITDKNNSCLRKVNNTTGTISTIAGTPQVVGYSGDGGAATAAKIAYPTNITIDPSGNIVFMDSTNACLRKVNNTTGTITTIAGNNALGAGFSGDSGPATLAQISNNCGLAFSSTGDLYIADGDNHCLRKVNNTTGTISTIAGTPSVAGFAGDGGPATLAKFNYPIALALDSSDNVYIVDNHNSCLRKVNNTTGTINTIAGTPLVAGFSGDLGAATAAKLNSPSGIAVNNSGKIFFTDLNNNRIRVISASGIINTVAGIDTFGFNGDGPCYTRELNAPKGINLNTSGNCLMVDQLNNRVRKIDYISMVDNQELYQIGISISPNPSKDNFNIKLITPENIPVQINITNISGEIIKQFSAYTNQSFELQLSVSPGVYFLKAVSRQGNWNEKLVVFQK